MFIYELRVEIFNSNQKKHHGAAEARRAHNPEGTGSKPVGAKEYFSLFLILKKKEGKRKENFTLS